MTFGHAIRTWTKLAEVNEWHVTHDMPLNLDDAMMLHSEATNFPPVFCATKPPVVGKDGRHVGFAASTFPLTGHTRTDAKPWGLLGWRNWRSTFGAVNKYQGQTWHVKVLCYKTEVEVKTRFQKSSPSITYGSFSVCQTNCHLAVEGFHAHVSLKTPSHGLWQISRK